MTAGNHRIIIEKGADFKIELQISENGIDMRDVTGYSVKMVIKYENAGSITELAPIAGFLVEDTEGSGTYLNGNIAVVIDKAITATYPTLVDAGLSPFTTEYNYFYSIDITEDGIANPSGTTGIDNIRVLRGKCSIRE